VSSSDPAEMYQPLTEYSHDQLVAGYRAQRALAAPGLAMFQDEFSRRTNVRTEHAITWLTRWVVVLTAILVGLGIVQILLLLKPTVVAAGPPPRSEAAAFMVRVEPSFYCVPPSGQAAPAGPCTVSAIFRNAGGSGTAIAEFTTAGGSCDAVIPSTPMGDLAEASCVVNALIPRQSKPRVAVTR
jgi:hypothetical protein